MSWLSEYYANERKKAIASARGLAEVESPFDTMLRCMDVHIQSLEEHLNQTKQERQTLSDFADKFGKEHFGTLLAASKLLS